MSEKAFLEVVEFETGRVVNRVDVSADSERTRERMERGLNINLDHDRFYTRVTRELAEPTHD